MKWTKTHRKKLTAIIHPHKSDPADFFPSAAEAWASTGIPGDAPVAPEADFAVQHFMGEHEDGSLRLSLTQYCVEAFGIEATIKLIRAAADSSEYRVFPALLTNLRRYFYRMDDDEFLRVKDKVFEGYDLETFRERVEAAFVLSRDSERVKAVIAEGQYTDELIAAAPSAELALQVVAASERPFFSFRLAFDLVENLGTGAIPVLEAILARYEGKGMFRKPIEQALRVAGGTVATKTKAPKKAAPKASSPTSVAATTGAVEFSRHVVAASSTGGKFWEVEVEGTAMRIRYGKVGTDPKWSSKSFDTHEKALKAAQSKLRSKINKGYAEAPKPGGVSKTKIDLATSNLRGVFYFRALDRHPGGNNDMFTIKVNAFFGADGASALSAATHRDFDGQHVITPESKLALSVEKTRPNLLNAAQTLLDGGQSQATFTIIDKRYDTEEYDTEWSSLEFFLYSLPDGSDAATPPEDGELVMHLTQKALSFTKQKGNAPDASSQAVIDAVHELVGIGRVSAYADGKGAFHDAIERAEGTSTGYIDKAIPLYL